MKSDQEKQRQNQLKKEFQKKQNDEFAAGLPMQAKYFLDLFDFLDEKLEAEGCDHTLKFTIQYLTIQLIPSQPVVTWLNENGGYCDCEVFNVEDSFENLK